MKLTRRQLEILQLLVEYKPSEIADILYVSPQTIKNHLTSLYKRLGVHTRIDAVHRGYMLGLIDLGEDTEEEIELTTNQIKLLNLLVDYQPSRIAVLYGINYQSLKNAISAIYQILRVNTRLDAVRKAAQLGFIEL